MKEDVNLVEFTENKITVTVFLNEDGVKELKEAWDSVESIQRPLVGAHKNGLSVFIPWILEGDNRDD